MRVIAGKAKGTRLSSVEGIATRPVLDRVKESVFSMLEARGAVEGADVLDLYAGSGSLGIEALSRGAARCVFVDSSTESARVIRVNLEKAGLAGAAEVFEGRCPAAMRRLAEAGRRFDLVFADPPFREAAEFGAGPEGAAGGLSETLALAAGALSPDGTLVLRVEKGTALPDRIGSAERIESRVWGRSEAAFYSGGSGERIDR